MWIDGGGRGRKGVFCRIVLRAFTRVWEGGVVLRASPRRGAFLPCHAFVRARDISESPRGYKFVEFILAMFELSCTVLTK